MARLSPIAFRWNVVEGTMAPLPGGATKAAHERFEDGKIYRLVEEPEHSDESRGHYFAALKEIFETLPDHYAAQFVNITHMRKYALIRTGYCTEVPFVAADPQSAALVVKELSRSDDYPLVYQVPDTLVVRIARAKSQRKAAMSKEEFLASKWDVLGFLADMIGADRATVRRMGEGR
jgi:hypothetical protein